MCHSLIILLHSCHFPDTSEFKLWKNWNQLFLNEWWLHIRKKTKNKKTCIFRKNRIKVYKGKKLRIYQMIFREERKSLLLAVVLEHLICEGYSHLQIPHKHSKMSWHSWKVTQTKLLHHVCLRSLWWPFEQVLIRTKHSTSKEIPLPF